MVLWWWQILEGTVSRACQYLSMLHCLIDGLALLDMLASFALAVRPAVPGLGTSLVALLGCQNGRTRLSATALVHVMQIGQADSTYVRPQLTEHGPMAIVEGRHPLVEQIIDVDYQPNNTYLAGAL